MNRQFDNRFDELFHEKFKDFDKNPPDYILDKIKASVEKQSLLNKISNFYKNNLLIAGFSLVIPALIIGFYFITAKKDAPALSQVKSVAISTVKKDMANQNSKWIATNETIKQNTENKLNKTTALFFYDEVCGLSFNLKATSNLGKWNCSNTGVIYSSENNSTTAVNVPYEGVYTFIWSPIEDSKSIENVKVKFLKQAKVEKTNEIVSCTNEIALEARSSNQVGTWTASNGVIFKNVNTPKTTALYNGFGKVFMVWTNNAKCALADTFSVIFAERADASFDISEPAKCSDSPVILTAKSKSLARYEWDAENSSTNNLTPGSVSIIWVDGVKHKVTLKAWTKDNCFSSSSIVMERPAPIDVKFDLKAAQCGNNGSIKAIPVNEKAAYQYFWMNEKKASGSIKDALAPGKYEVVVRDNNACSKAYSLEIAGTGAIKASFYHSNYNVNPPSTVYFVNTTTENRIMYDNSDAIKFEWDFGDGQKSEEESPSHTYAKAGNYIVKLIAINKDGCTNTFTATDIAIDPSRVIVPNVFSPNGDGTNDVFKVNSASLSKFHVSVANAKGEIVYEWSDPDKGWDGTILRSGASAAAGVYYYIVNAVGKDGKQYEDKGAVQLVRE